MDIFTFELVQRDIFDGWYLRLILHWVCYRGLVLSWHSFLLSLLHGGFLPWKDDSPCLVLSALIYIIKCFLRFINSCAKVIDLHASPPLFSWNAAQDWGACYVYHVPKNRHYVERQFQELLYFSLKDSTELKFWPNTVDQCWCNRTPYLPYLCPHWSLSTAPQVSSKHSQLLWKNRCRNKTQAFFWPYLKTRYL